MHKGVVSLLLPPFYPLAMLPLTEASLAARDAAIDEEALTGAGDNAAAAALHSLIDAEASFQRREHLAALQREFNRLEALSAKDASGWDERRQAMAACAVQAAWRRQTTRRGFRRAGGAPCQSLRATFGASGCFPGRPPGRPPGGVRPRGPLDQEKVTWRTGSRIVLIGQAGEYFMIVHRGNTGFTV